METAANNFQRDYSTKCCKSQYKRDNLPEKFRVKGFLFSFFLMDRLHSKIRRENLKFKTFIQLEHINI